MVDRCVRIECFVRGYHVYKSQWRPDLGDRVETKLEEFNEHDRYAVAVVVDGATVGHIPREISKICHYFKKRGGTIVTGKRKKSDVYMKGLEIPCVYEFMTQNHCQSEKLVKLLKERQTHSFTIKFL